MFSKKKKNHPLEVQSSREQSIPFKCLSARLCLVRGSSAVNTDFEQRQRTNLAQIRDNSTLIRNFIVFIFDGLTLHEQHFFSLSLPNAPHCAFLFAMTVALSPKFFPSLNSLKMLFAVFIHCHIFFSFFLTSLNDFGDWSCCIFSKLFF